MPQCDPDQSLEIKEEVKDKLKQSIASVQHGEKGVPIEQVAKELGIEMEE